MKIQGCKRLGYLLAVALLTASLLLSSGPRAAQAQEAAPLADQAYLIPIQPPELGTQDLPAHMGRAEAQRAADRLLARQTGTVLDAVRNLAERGLVGDYELLPEAPVVRVTLAAENAAEVLQGLPGNAALVEESQALPACLAGAAERLPGAVLAAGLAQDWRDAAAAGEQPLAAHAPVIQVYYHAEGGFVDAYVHGLTAPKTEVQMRILRNGKEVGLDYEKADDDGFYAFQSDYFNCLGGQNWTLQAGDVVEISAAGATAATTVTPVTAWLDPEANTAAGFTAPNRTVRVELSQLNRAAPCDGQTAMQTGSADGAGNFSVALGSTLDFDRSAGAVVHSVDAAGNSTYDAARPYHLLVLADGNFSLTLRPQTDFDLTLKRGAATIETVSGTAGAETGEFSGVFVNPVQQGDAATLTYAGGQLAYTVAAWPSFSVNRATGQVSGNASNGMLLVGSYQNDSISVLPRCAYGGNCAAQTVPANGAVALNFGPLYNGETLWLDAYTPEGEKLSYFSFEPSLEAYPHHYDVEVRWWPTNYLKITLKSSTNAVKGSRTFDLAEAKSDFLAHFSAGMVPGDRIEVTDGSQTRSMTVATLTIQRVNSTTDHLTGTASAGRLVAFPQTWTGACVERDHAGGAFDVPVGMDILGFDNWEVDLLGGDGQYTTEVNYSLSLNLSLDVNYVSGRTETASTTVAWTHKRGAAVLDSGSANSGTDRYFYFYSDGIFQPGDVLTLTTGDGNQAEIAFPEITAQVIPAERRVVGQAVPGQWVQVEVLLSTPDYSSSIWKSGWADGAGEYSIHFRPEYWDLGCLPLDLGGACQALRVSAGLENGFWVFFYQAAPVPAADGFEPDDTWQTASSYTGKQAHSLHTAEDEDWVKFTVSPEDAAEGVEYQMRVMDAGLLVDLKLELYASTNLTTPIASAQGELDPSVGSLPPVLAYTFTQAGTYYLRIHSKSGDLDGGHCRSTYDLLILGDAQSLFLPLVIR